MVAQAGSLQGTKCKTCWRERVWPGNASTAGPILHAGFKIWAEQDSTFIAGSMCSLRVPEVRGLAC